MVEDEDDDKGPYRDPFKLLVPKETLVIDAAQQLNYLTAAYPDILKDNPKGIYKLGEVEPILVDHQCYYTKQGLKHGKPIEDINTVREAVYNAKGELLLNDFVMQHKKAFLSNSCATKHYGVKAIEYYINKIIEQNSEYIRNKYYETKFLSCFKPEYRNAIYEQTIDVDLSMSLLADMVYNFIKHQGWTMFFVKRIGTVIMVEKTIDYRVFDWTIKVNEGIIKF